MRTVSLPPGVVTSQWELAADHGRRIYTRECIRTLPFFLESWFLSTSLFTPWRRKWQPTPVFLPGKVPWTEEPGGLQSVGLQRVRHDRAAKRTHTLFTSLRAHHWLNDEMYLIC